MMPLLLILTLAPTLSFYFYVLVQFMKETTRRRNHDTCALIVPLHSESARQANYGVRELAAPRAKRHEGSRMVSLAPFAVEDTNQDADSPRAEVIVTQLKSRLAAYQGGTGRLAAKRAAKG